MRLPVLKIAEGIKWDKQNRTRIGVGYVVKEKVGEMEDNTREVRSRSMRK